MKKLVAVLSVATLLTTACSSDEANTGERAESEWNNFIQKHLIGEWKPSSFVIKPLIGEPILQKEYAHIGQPTDIVVLHKDFTGYFKMTNALREQKEVAFQWYHRFEELGITWSSGLETKAVLLHKSSHDLEIAFPLAEVLPYVGQYLPEVTNLDHIAVNELVVVCKFVK